ncbi:unnamed protein product, partial [Prorocentrum cordatum]
RLPATGSKRESRIDKQFADMAKKLEQLTAPSRAVPVRSNIESRRSGLTQNSNVGHGLNRANAKFEKFKQELADFDKNMGQLQEDRADADAEWQAAEYAALQKQLVASLPLDSDAGVDVFG